LTASTPPISARAARAGCRARHPRRQLAVGGHFQVRAELFVELPFGVRLPNSARSPASTRLSVVVREILL
jgi:hypothetical protein